MARRSGRRTWRLTRGGLCYRLGERAELAIGEKMAAVGKSKKVGARAAKAASILLLQEADRASVARARELIEGGASISDARDISGRDALMAAAAGGNCPLVQELLSLGANPLRVDGIQGNSAFLWAADALSAECAKALADVSDKTLKNAHGWSALTVGIIANMHDRRRSEKDKHDCLAFLASVAPLSEVDHAWANAPGGHGDDILFSAMNMDLSRRDAEAEQQSLGRATPEGAPSPTRRRSSL